MTPDAFIIANDAHWRIAFFLCLCAIGYLIIRALNLHLPLPRTFSDLILFSFWNYPSNIERSRVGANKIAWFCVWLIAALMVFVAF
jgi:hypothetical protein